MVPRTGFWAKDGKGKHKTIDAIPSVIARRFCGIVSFSLIAMNLPPAISNLILAS
jgi:hypothetical protein